MNIDALVENFYKKVDNEDLVNEVLQFLLIEGTQVLKEQQSVSLSFDGIPDIPIAEIPWSTIKNQESGADIPAPQRKQLMDFLSQIEGDDLPAKVKSLAKFYETDPNELLKQGFFGNTAKEQISKALSYLTFYKTLTKIIAHFNAASAGFSFESFLGVLLGGVQVPTGQKTIADLLTGDGVPISLKLYTEKQLKVGGSFTDLVSDLVRYDKMQYVAVTKLLNEEATAGTLDFYRFDFTLDNVVPMLAQVGLRSEAPNPQLIQLPAAFIANPAEFEEMELPEAPKQEELLELFRSRVLELGRQAGIDEKLLLQGLEVLGLPDDITFLSTNGGKKIFGHPKSMLKSSGVRVNFARGMGVLPDAFSVTEKPPSRTPERAEWNQLYKGAEEIFITLYKGILAPAYLDVVQASSRAIRARQELAAKAGGEYLSTEDSVREYAALSPELKRRALLVSRGFVGTEQFELIQSEVAKIQEYAADALPGGQDTVYIGTIEVGEERIVELLNSVTKIIDASIFAIFEDLKTLTTNIQSYFANGLKDDKQADAAITASDSIGERTEELKGEN